MRNGKYHYAVVMDVPLGKRSGCLDFTVCGNKIIGFMTMFMETLPITEGQCIGNQISFSGKMKTILNSFAYVADGKIDRDQIRLLFHTEHGDYPAQGRKRFRNIIPGEQL